MSKRNQRLREFREKAAEIRQRSEEKREAAFYEQRDPVKQYIRRYGWLEIITPYIRKLREAGVRRPWKYLTLPGEYGSDIGLLWREEVLDRAEDGRLSLAICDQEFAEKVAAKLQKLGGLLAYGTRPLEYELEDPSGSLRGQFPFDVINLDLCNPLIPPVNQSNLRIIEWIFRLQKGQGFLLLLTTRPEPRARERLRGLLADNLSTEERFREAYEGVYQGSDPELCLRDYTRFTQLIFPKAIARWARELGYTVNEHFAAKYARRRGGGTSYDMVCHSFEFTPIGVPVAENIFAPRPRWTQSVETSIDDRLNRELPAKTRNAAADAYVDFICTLPNRTCVNAEELIAADPNLALRLGEESVIIADW
jgi:hypothetical protein